MAIGSYNFRLAIRCSIAALFVFFSTFGVLSFFFPRSLPKQATQAKTVADPSAHAAKLANDECEQFFQVRPFEPNTFPLEFADDRYEWGRLDPIGVKGYSAIVSFARDGGTPRVSVYWSGFDGDFNARAWNENSTLEP